MDFSERRFGRLTPLERSQEGHRVYWLCACACGVQKRVREDHLESGDIKSCGCLRREQNEARRLFFGGDRVAYLRHLWRTTGKLYGRLDDSDAAKWTRRDFENAGYRIVQGGISEDE